MEAITTAVTSIFSVMGSVLDEVTGEPVLMMFFVSGLVGIGCGVLQRLKNL